MFKKILIANRGEIAARLFAACKGVGIPSVAIYSDADAGAEWVHLADEAHPLGGKSASDSYLNQQKIIEIALACGANGIHPGYGFLSENPTFAEACAAAGIKFIGPSPDAMRRLGSKASAREISKAAGVPVTPGIDGAGKSIEEMAAEAANIGYPVLIKASAGGGGKGMRVVNDPQQFSDAYVAAREEALNSFGDGHLILEKFFTRIHHIEIQILGDEHGNILHLFERECSIQRRHQKIIEESPSPTISNELRSKIAEAAVKLAQAVQYTSAGTVEFMYTDDGRFYLLEMNTRLQVEHPVTEFVTGIDIPKWQIHIAAGVPLPFDQTAIAQRGHAIECRLYAEDPANSFLPSIGPLTQVRFPQMPGLRIDAGIKTGEEVTPFYDPMLAKIITYGQTRADAIDSMLAALRETVILGITTNLSYLIAILEEENFRKGETTTKYLETHFDGWKEPAPDADSVTFQIGLAAFEMFGLTPRTSSGANQLEADSDAGFDPWNQPSGWRNVS